MAGEGAHYGFNPIKEDVQNFIYQITSVDTPVYDDIGDSKAMQPVHTWQTRALTTRADNAQVEGASFTDTNVINTTLVTNVDDGATVEVFASDAEGTAVISGFKFTALRLG